jgi:hypothetical protein
MVCKHYIVKNRMCLEKEKKEKREKETREKEILQRNHLSPN